MTSSAMKPVTAYVLVALGLAIGAMGFYVAAVDDAPGAAFGGAVLAAAAVILGVRAMRQRLPAWATRTALIVVLPIAALTAYLTHATAVAAPLFARPQDIPSVVQPAPPAPWGAAVERARQRVRAAIGEQNLPGVSVAVGLAKEGLVWAEGFGWRDIVTETPVTPNTRFHIGTATRVVVPEKAAELGMTHTGADAAAEWSPSHNGEPEDDFPPLTAIHDLILRPVGLADPAKPLPDERATFYVPRTDDHNPRRGRRPIYMRDLACCAGQMAFSSTPSDLVRFALATQPDSVDGELAGGSVMSLVTRRDTGVVVAVTSNITHAGTSALAQQIADAFGR